MKKFLILILVFSLIVWVSIRLDKTNLTDLSRLYYISACETPVSFKIGDIDPRFNLSRDELLTNSKQAEAVWNNAQSNLLIYDPNASLSVNFIYDERQALNNQIKHLQTQVDDQKKTLNPEITDYESKVLDFNKRVDDLNSRVKHWNEKGGAPEDEFQKLVKEQDDLKKEAGELNQIARSLNRSTEQINGKIGELNQTVDVFKEAIENKPEEGIFDPASNRIDIYFNISRNELIHTLSHEMGHALGLGHVQNSKAIMYGFSTQQTALSKDDISELNYVCRKRSVFDIFYERLILLKSLAGNIYNSAGFN